MKNQKGRQLALVLVLGGIILFSLYFSVFTILRYQKLVASYFDLGIMHQTVYNTYRAIQTFDFSRFLEMTDPHGFEQVKRMAIHNDIFLALIAPLYFIYPGPETLLILQAIIVSLGALAIFYISEHVFTKRRGQYVISTTIAWVYLMYVPLQRAVIFEFHAVTLATSLLLFMYLFWLKKRYVLSLLFLLLSLLTKEHVGLTTAFFGLALIADTLRATSIQDYVKKLRSRFQLSTWYPLLVIIISTLWSVISMKVIIPFFRSEGGHFALEYYSDTLNFPKYIFNINVMSYVLTLMGPVVFLPLISPIHFFITIPEFAINILSKSSNMRNIIYHYTSVITPFIFISAIYGISNLNSFITTKGVLKPKSLLQKNVLNFIAFGLGLITIFYSAISGPLPFSQQKDTYPFTHKSKAIDEIRAWSTKLKDEHIKVSTTGHFAPFFTSRRYFYNFSKHYVLSDYVIVSINEAKRGWQKEIMAAAYDTLRYDPDYLLVYKHDDLEVYKRINKLSE